MDDFLSNPKQNHFQCSQCCKQKQCYKTRCFLSNGNVGGDYSEKADSDGGEAYQINETNFVYIEIPINDRKRGMTTVSVEPGNNIDNIRKLIKKENRNIFASIDAIQIELYESLEQEEPLNALEKWSPNATWGTQQQPLIVKVNPLIASLATTSPWKRSFGKCNFVRSGV
jgi:hypothetical protein